MRGRRTGPAQRVDLGLALTEVLHLVDVPLEGRDPDVVAWELWEAGAAGLEEIGGGFRAAFASREAALGARDRFAPGASIAAHTDHAGTDAARDRLNVERAGRFAVHPPWLRPPPDAIAIEIDPAHAFGSGSHASTRLALELVGRHVRRGDHVVDIGCGTGVLAIGAALLGATVTAIDHDPDAVEAARANVGRNGAADTVDVRLGVAERVPPGALAIINVTIDVHESIAPALDAAGRVIVSGILDTQLARAAAAYRADVVEAASEGEWVAAMLRPHVARSSFRVAGGTP